MGVRRDYMVVISMTPRDGRWVWTVDVGDFEELASRPHDDSLVRARYYVECSRKPDAIPTVMAFLAAGKPKAMALVREIYLSQEATA